MDGDDRGAEVKAGKVMHLRASRFVGGPERQILRYARLAQEAGVESVIASFVGNGEGEAFLAAARKQGSETLALPSGTRAAYGALRAALRAQQPALLCTHGYKADILGIIAGRREQVPVASFLRGWTGEDLKVRSYEALNQVLLSRTGRVVCLSELQRKEYGGQKTRLVINAIERVDRDIAEARRQLRQRFGLAPEAVVVAAAGRLSPEKGTTFLVQSAKMVAPEFTTAHFIIFGDGSLRKELEAQAAEVKQIHFAGHVTDFRELLAGVDLLVNPSLSEEMPNVVLEAMALGVPVIATAVGGVPEIAGVPPALRLIALGDSLELAAALREALQAPSQMRTMGERGRERVRSAYSPERQKDQLLALYSEFMPVQRLAPLCDQPFVSVVMPVRNEERHIGDVLRQLAEQDYPVGSFEVLVTDGNSTDGTRQVVEEFARTARFPVRWLPNPKQLSSAGRNVGARAARGDIIAFIDGHCSLPSKTLLSDMVKLFRETGAGALCRPQPLHAPGNTEFQDALARTRATVIGHGRDSTIFDLENEHFVDPTSSGAIYRREVFERIGFYDEDFDACEDVEFNFRVSKSGLTSYSSPKVAVLYTPRASLGALWKQLLRYGRGRYRFMRKHADATTLAQLVPAGFLLWLTFAGALAPFFSPAAWALGGTLALYFTVVLAFAIRLGIRYGWHHLYISPAVYMCIHGGLGAGFWQEAFFGPRMRPQAVTAGPGMTGAEPSKTQDPRREAAWSSATSNKR